MGKDQAAFEAVILRLRAPQKLDAVDLQSHGDRHQRRKQEERLVFHQKLPDPPHLLKIFRARKVEKGNLNVWVHAHLIGMAVVTIMFLLPPGITHANQEVASHQTYNRVFRGTMKHLMMS